MISYPALFLAAQAERVMQLTLRLADVPMDAIEITGTVRIDDQREADAPARGLAQQAFGPMPLPAGGVTVSVPDERLSAGASLNIRAEVRDAGGGVTRFVNTTAIPAPPSGTRALTVELDRI
jgi:hypothetical protein